MRIHLKSTRSAINTRLIVYARATERPRPKFHRVVSQSGFTSAGARFNAHSLWRNMHMVDVPSGWIFRPNVTFLVTRSSSRFGLQKHFSLNAEADVYVTTDVGRMRQSTSEEQTKVQNENKMALEKREGERSRGRLRQHRGVGASCIKKAKSRPDKNATRSTRKSFSLSSRIYVFSNQPAGRESRRKMVLVIIRDAIMPLDKLSRSRILQCTSALPLKVQWLYEILRRRADKSPARFLARSRSIFPKPRLKSLARACTIQVSCLPEDTTRYNWNNCSSLLLYSIFTMEHN